MTDVPDAFVTRARPVPSHVTPHAEPLDGPFAAEVERVAKDRGTTVVAGMFERARAIENTVHVVGVGQPGPRYTGHSMVVDPLGGVVVEGGDGPETLTADLDPAAVAEARRTNPSLANRRL